LSRLIGIVGLAFIALYDWGFAVLLLVLIAYDWKDAAAGHQGRPWIVASFGAGLASAMFIEGFAVIRRRRWAGFLTFMFMLGSGLAGPFTILDRTELGIGWKLALQTALFLLIPTGIAFYVMCRPEVWRFAQRLPPSEDSMESK